jgi:hypothetical protein
MKLSAFNSCSFSFLTFTIVVKIGAFVIASTMRTLGDALGVTSMDLH